MTEAGSGRTLPRFLSYWAQLLLPVCLLAAALAIQFTDPQFHARIRAIAFDQLQSISPLPYRKELPVRVIAIDDASLSAIGQWPWSRTVIAQIVDRLTGMGAKVIAFDVLFPEPDRSSPEQLSASWPKQPALQDMLKRMPEHDKLLAESISRSMVVLGFPIEPSASSAALPPEKARWLSFGGNAEDWLHRYEGALSSLPLLTRAAAGSGAISLDPEDGGGDGVLRKVPLLYHVRDSMYPGLGLEAVRLFAGLDNLGVEVVSSGQAGEVQGIAGISLGEGAFQPTTSNGQVWLHFRRLAPERYLSAKDLLAGNVDASLVKDHIVFIGATAKGLGDTIYSPLDELIPGVEGHVQLTEQLLTGETLSRTAWENDAVAIVLTGTWLVLGFLFSRYRPVWSVLFSVLVILGLFALSLWLFVARHALFDPLYPSLVLGVLFLSVMVPRYLKTEWEQRWIRDAFSRYVSPNRVKYLQAHHQQLELGAVNRECSFVMCDLEGFTSLMEKYEPAQLSSLINEYLEGMIQIIFKHEGTLDRIVGDAVVALFSAPLVQDDHAARALACALEMDAFAKECARRQRELGVPFGRTRIGVNTGTVLIGNFGGKTMLDYRALGDPINTAARLESVNKQLGTHICMSAATVDRCPGFIGRPSGYLVLKGKQDAVETFEPLTREQAAEPYILDYLAAYALMEAESPEAKSAFATLSEKYPDDPLAVFHAKRLAEGQTGCTVVMTSK